MRSAGSAGPYSGRILATFSRNQAGEPDQPTRSANTVAGIRGFSISSARIAGSMELIPDSCGARTYAGGPSALTAFATVFLEIPNRAAIDLIDSPSARCNRRISAQSSTVITHPIVWNGWLSFQPSQWLTFQPSPTRSMPASDGWPVGIYLFPWP